MSQATRQYKTVGDFRRALEDRIKILAEQEKTPLDRLRRRVAFDRVLARFFKDQNPQWLLKGGYALEFRLHNAARSTKDIDFSFPEMREPTAERVLDILREEVRKDGGDWFEFLIGVPVMKLSQAVYGGWRYPVECRLDNRIFSKFHLDVSVGDAVVSMPEWRKGQDFFGFAGISAPNVALLPLDQQFAEKIHAYSLPRTSRPNSRTRDLVDIVLIIDFGLPNKESVRKALHATFKRRDTHALPTKLVPPPENWRASYRKMAEECGVSKKTVDEAFAFLENYWEGIF